MNYEVKNGKVQTRALEFHIVDHCNLRCEHCCSFSPVLKKWEVTVDDFERDLRLVSRSIAPQILKIVGGEPLLHPELPRLLAIARDLNVAPSISLTTNAHLIERFTRDVWDGITMLTISLYPDPALPRETIALIAAEAKRRDIPVSWKMQDKFTCLDRTEVQDYESAKKIFGECWIHHRCHSIKDGRFYCCTRPQYIRRFAPNPATFIADGFLLGENTLSLTEDLRRYLERKEPLNSCYLCNGGNASLETHQQLSSSAVRQKRESLKILCAQISTLNP